VKSLKLLHAADLHLDSPMKAFGDRPGEGGALGELFRKATLLAFTRLIDVALREQVDAVLLAGDLYDARDRSVRARLHLATQLERLHAEGIETFIVHGNHDPLAAGAGALALPSSVTVFPASHARVERVGRHSKVPYAVQGVSYPEERVSQNLAQQFRRGEGPSRLEVGLLHCNLSGGGGEHANYAPCTVEELSAAQLDYWALGHVHTRRLEPLASGGLAAYPGNLQGRHANEPGPRGALLVELSPGSRPAARFLPLEVVRWHALQVELGEAQGLVELQEACLHACAGLDAAGVAGHAVRLTLSGRGAVHADLRGEGRAQLEEALRARLLPQGVLLEKLLDDSLPQLELQALAQEGGLRGELSRVALEGVRPGRLAELMEDEALQGLLQRLAGAGVKLPLEGAQREVQAAALEALELLMQEGA
jgi:DNA repair exonuclease SbcCD nuclease subunit